MYINKLLKQRRTSYQPKLIKSFIDLHIKIYKNLLVKNMFIGFCVDFQKYVFTFKSTNPLPLQSTIIKYDLTYSQITLPAMAVYAWCYYKEQQGSNEERLEP
uniref:Uncharacterized protein n=1 Tax=Coccidioides posadasii RMSCC 3488 TaxID=454284 RepID=A0A0J6FHG8_COCPO|nr:hypothetical protein CPAG_06067 [Coccidioides posadasii RMSCC 3488]